MKITQSTVRCPWDAQILQEREHEDEKSFQDQIDQEAAAHYEDAELFDCD